MNAYEAGKKAGMGLKFAEPIDSLPCKYKKEKAVNAWKRGVRDGYREKLSSIKVQVTFYGLDLLCFYQYIKLALIYQQSGIRDLNDVEKILFKIVREACKEGAIQIYEENQ